MKLKEISDAPIAAASLAQVYKATTANNATVAVKVRRPGVVDQVALDCYAVRLLLAWLQPDSWDPVRAAACVEEPSGMPGRGPELAVELKQVLVARGHWVPVPSLSDEPAHVGAGGEAVLPLVDELPEVREDPGLPLLGSPPKRYLLL